MTIILHSYTDIRPFSQIETLHGMIDIAHFCERVYSERMVHEDSYWKFLLRYWGDDEIVNIEQDIAATPNEVIDLTACNYMLCCFPYELDNGKWSVGYPDEHLVHESYRVLPNFAEFSGLGLVKFSKWIQRRIPLHEYPIDRYKWWYLDTWIGTQLPNLHIKYHVHKPAVKHNRNLKS